MKTALGVIGRLENRYAVEWVEYYKQLGIDHIFIADNNHDGEEYFEDVLQSYIDENFVSILNYRNQLHIQEKFYTEMYNKIGNEYDWIMFFDFDEFLTLTEDKTIQDYLSRNEKYNVICINWKAYTDNDLIYDDGRPCLERFTKSINNKEDINNTFVKSIIKCNINNVIFNNAHIPTSISNNLIYGNNEFNDFIGTNIMYNPINHNLAYIKHFYTKTIEEFIKYKVKKKGDMTSAWHDTDESYIKTRTKSFFEINNINEDKIIFLKNYYNDNDIKEYFCINIT